MHCKSKYHKVGANNNFRCLHFIYGNYTCIYIYIYKHVVLGSSVFCAVSEYSVQCTVHMQEGKAITDNAFFLNTGATLNVTRTCNHQVCRPYMYMHSAYVHYTSQEVYSTDLCVHDYPGAKVRVITREVRYYSRVRIILRHYFASSRCVRGYMRMRNFARSRVKIISARQFKGAHERCVKATPPFTRVRACSRAISCVSMVNTFEV